MYLVHSCASEQRVSAELKVDGSVVKVSIPIEYNMDVYVAPQDNRSSLAGINHVYIVILSLSTTGVATGDQGTAHAHPTLPTVGLLICKHTKCFFGRKGVDAVGVGHALVASATPPPR